MNYVKCLYQSLFQSKDIETSYISIYILLYFVIFCCITFSLFLPSFHLDFEFYIGERWWSLKDHNNVRQAGIEIQVVMFNRYVTLGKLLNLFKPQVEQIAMRSFANLINGKSMQQAQNSAGTQYSLKSMLIVILVLIFIIAIVNEIGSQNPVCT